MPGHAVCHRLFLCGRPSADDAPYPVESHPYGKSDRLLRLYNRRSIRSLVGQSLYFRSDAATTQRRGAAYTFLAMPLLGFQLIVTSYFQSIRQAPKAITMNISRQFLFLIPALGLFSHWWGLTGIWLAIPFSDLMATLIALFFLWRTNRKAD